MSNKFKIENLPTTTLSASNDDLTIFERNGITHKIGMLDFTQPKFVNLTSSSTMGTIKPNTISIMAITNGIEISQINFDQSVSSSCSKSYVIVVDRRNDSDANDWFMPFASNFYPSSSKNADFSCLAQKINIFYIREILPSPNSIFIVNGQSI